MKFIKEAKGLILAFTLLVLAFTLFVCAVKADSPQDFVEATKSIIKVAPPLIEVIK